MPKSTKAEISRRILEVYTMLIQNYSYTDIVRYCSENYKTGKRNADKYIKFATQRIIKSNNDSTEDLRKKTTEQLKDLYKRCYDKSDYSECSRILSRLAKINGLESIRIEGNIDITNNIKKMTREEIEAELKKINGE